jgi:uncharacterized protein YndB with AHSA1/START domain
MNDTSAETVSVVVERDLPQPPEKVWRALTEPTLIEQWLMKNDFEPVVGHRFKFSADWGSVDGEVKTVEPDKRLVYTWAAFGAETLVTWDLTSAGSGTRVRMEQSGFRADQPQFTEGAKGGWQRFFAALEAILARMD